MYCCYFRDLRLRDLRLRDFRDFRDFRDLRRLRDLRCLCDLRLRLRFPNIWVSPSLFILLTPRIRSLNVGPTFNWSC